MATAAKCAGCGNGYWLCDVPGGCPGCRHLAANIDDSAQFDEWGDDLMSSGQPDRAAKRYATAQQCRQVDQ